MNWGYKSKREGSQPAVYRIISLFQTIGKCERPRFNERKSAGGEIWRGMMDETRGVVGEREDIVEDNDNNVNVNVRKSPLFVLLF